MAVKDLNAEISAAFWREHWRDLQRRHSIRLETTHRAKDGRIIPVEVSANYVVFEGREYNCAIVRDISQRKLYESQLKEAADRYGKMLSTAGDGFWLVDATTGRLLRTWMPPLRSMSGYSREELLSKTISRSGCPAFAGGDSPTTSR
jgi:PAS domain-containing protein